MCAATANANVVAEATADVTASAANNTWIFKRKMAMVSQKH